MLQKLLNKYKFKNNGILPMYGPGGQKQNPPKVYTDKKKFEQAQRLYTDSLNLYNNNLNYKKKYLDFVNKIGFNKEKLYESNNGEYIDVKQNPKIGAINYGYLRSTGSSNEKNNKGGYNESDYFQLKNGNDIKVSRNSPEWHILNKGYYNYKKPIQPVVYQPQQTINTTQGQVTGIVRPNQIKGSELMMMINPVRSKDNLERMEMIPYTFNNPKVVPRGELLPVPQMRLPQQGNRPFYGPGNTIIGYTDDNRQFYPAQQYTGAPNNQLNLQDKELLNNPEMLQRYVQSKDNYKFAEGGGIPERYKNMGFTNVGAKKDSTRPGKKWMVLAKKGEDYKVVHGGYQGMQDFKQHHSEQRRENFWNRMGGKDSAKANDPFSPLYWHKRFGTWKYGGQLPKFGGGGSDHYVNLGPLQNKMTWGSSNPLMNDTLDSFQQQGQEIANQVAETPVMELDPNQNTREPISDQASIQPNVKTKTVREPFNQKYMMASNALFTGLDMLGKRNKNSYSNAIKDYNKNQSDYENNNVDLYSTKQDYYGMFSEGGNLTESKRKLKDFYETMSQDPTYYSDELQVLKDDYNKILQEEEAERTQNLEDYINGRVNSIQPERVIVQDDMTYVPYRAPERRPLYSDETNGEMSYQPTYAPEMNIGFNVKPGVNAQFAYNFFKEKGFTPHQAAGLVGNFTQESNVNPNITNRIGAFGAAQWLGPRKEALIAFAKSKGKPANDLKTQLEFTLHELNTTEKKAKSALLKTKTPEQAALVVRKKYERPGESEANDKRRINAAQNLYYGR